MHAINCWNRPCRSILFLLTLYKTDINRYQCNFISKQLKSQNRKSLRANQLDSEISLINSEIQGRSKVDYSSLETLAIQILIM